MPVDGVTGSEGVRTQKVQTERRSEDVRVEEQRRAEASDRDVGQARQVTEPGRGGNMDVTA